MVARKGNMTKRQKTKYPGVYERILTDRNGKVDTAFDIVYRHEHKKIWETIGRKSAGVNAAYAARMRAERLKNIESQKFIAPGNMLTFKQAAENFLSVHMAGKASADHMRGYLENHILPVFGDAKMDKIRSMHIEALKKSIQDKGLSPQTEKHVVAFVRQVYRKALAWGIYAGNIPTDGVQMPRVDAARLRFLTEKEAEMLFEALKSRSPQWHDIAYVSLYTGMRLGEILSLKVGHVNIPAGIINVMDAKAGTRAAYMSKGVQEILLRRCCGKGTEQFVFEQKEGGQIHFISSAFQRIVSRLFNQGVTDARYKVVFHTLRHTFGSWLAQKGVPLYTIAELMGHSTLEMTKRYSKLSPDTKRDALSLLPTIKTPSADDG